jgi:hypothetical protein
MIDQNANMEQENDQSDICEVKEIIDDRTINNKIEYTVKWTEKSKDSWVKESDFGTVDVINEYWKREFEADKGVVKKRRGRLRLNFVSLV